MAKVGIMTFPPAFTALLTTVLSLSSISCGLSWSFPVSVGGLHDYVVCSVKDRGIVEKRLVPLTDIACEDYVLRSVLVLENDFNHG